MISYRPFFNADPPEFVRLWHECGLGRGAATGFDHKCDVFELFVFSHPFFDPEGLIFAVEDDQIVGAIHAGFAVNAQQTALSKETGVICAVLVHPEFRGQGIGRELVTRAEEYLQSRGATTILAGPFPGADPFYFGLYGGSEPAGFLDSDPAAAPFFAALGYRSRQAFLVFQKPLGQKRDPVSMRLMGIKRKHSLAIGEHRQPPTWWSSAHQGNLESLLFELVTKSDEMPVAGVTVFTLDFYTPKWQQRAIGLTDLFVPEEHRQSGFAQFLLLETCRRMKEELFTLAEAHAPEDNPAAVAALESAGFDHIDTGRVFEKSA